MNRFEQALASGRTLLLDGGLATELEAQGHAIDTQLWSAAILLENPRAIVDVHLAFLEAGAQCITSASYQASRAGFLALGLTAAAADRLIAASVDLACQARAEYLDRHPGCPYTPLVAASVGPYGATLHDGSEYTGACAIDSVGLRAFHAERVGVLDLAGADLLACETISNGTEAGVLGEVLLHAQTPAWLSFACRDDRSLNDGTPLRDVAMRFADHPGVLALGINCTPPHLLTSLIGELRAAAPNKAVVVYPNSGERYAAADNTWHGGAQALDYGRAALDWRSAGAGLIGGCCRVTPAHIAAMRAALQAA